jgi:hypothetical protein
MRHCRDTCVVFWVRVYPTLEGVAVLYHICICTCVDMDSDGDPTSNPETDAVFGPEEVDEWHTDVGFDPINDSDLEQGHPPHFNEAECEGIDLTSPTLRDMLSIKPVLGAIDHTASTAQGAPALMSRAPSPKILIAKAFDF